MTTTTTAPLQAHDGYVMGRTSDEAERLRMQSRLLVQPTAAILDLLGLAAGMSCLDVGCGAGDVMAAIGERVSPGGRVVGLDVNAALGRAAVERLNATDGGATYEFVEGDALATDAIAPAGFSLTFARFLLLHVHEPEAVLRRMWEWTEPGGVLAVVDLDFGATREHASFVCETLRFAEKLFTRAGLDHRTGTTLPGYFDRAGLGRPDGVQAIAMFEPSEVMAAYLKASYESSRPAALKLGVTTEERSERLLAELDAEAHRSDGGYVVGPLVVGAWKRKGAGARRQS